MQTVVLVTEMPNVLCRMVSETVIALKDMRVMVCSVRVRNLMMGYMRLGPGGGCGPVWGWVGISGGSGGV